MAARSRTSAREQEFREFIHYSDSEGDSQQDSEGDPQQDPEGDSPVILGAPWPPATKVERFVAYSEIFKRSIAGSTLVSTELSIKQWLFAELLYEFPNLHGEVEEWYRRNRSLAHVEIAKQTSTKDERFVLYTRMAMEEHVITILRTKTIKVGGVFTKLLNDLPVLQGEIEEWYSHNKDNKELELCKSEHHGILNARATIYKSRHPATTCEYNELNAWKIKNLYDPWQSALETGKKNHDRLLAGAFRPHQPSGRGPLEMEVAHNGLKHPAAGNFTLSSGLGGCPRVVRERIEEDFDLPGSSIGLGGEEKQHEKPSMQSRKRIQIPGQMSNEIQTPIDSSSDHPAKRSRYDTSNAPGKGLGQLSAHSQNESQASVSGPMIGMTGNSEMIMGLPASLSGRKPQCRAANQASAHNSAPSRRNTRPPVNDCPLASRYPSRLGDSIPSSSGIIQLASQTTVPAPAISCSGHANNMVGDTSFQSEDRNRTTDLLTADPVNMQTQQMDVQPKHRAMSQLGGLERPMNTYRNSQSGRVEQKNASECGKGSPNLPTGGDMIDSSSMDLIHTDARLLQISISDQGPRTSNAHFQSRVQENEMAFPSWDSNNSQKKQRSWSMPTGERGVSNGYSHGPIQGNEMYPPSMNSHHNQASHGSMGSHGYYNGLTQGFGVQGPSVNNPYSHSLSNGNGYMPNPTSMIYGFYSPASNASPNFFPGAQAQLPSSGRSWKEVQKELSKEREALVARYCLSEERQVFLKTLYKSLSTAVWQNNQGKAHATRREIEAYVKTLRERNSGQQSHSTGQHPRSESDNDPQTVFGNATQGMCGQISFPTAPLTPSFVRNQQPSVGETQQSSASSHSLTRTNGTAHHPVASNRPLSMAPQDSPSAQPLTADGQAARVKQVRQMVEDDFNDMTKRYSYTETQELNLDQVLEEWGDALLREDHTAARNLRQIITSYRQAERRSVREASGATPSSVAMPSLPTNQAGSHVLGGLGQLQLDGEPRSGIRMQQVNQPSCQPNHDESQRTMGSGDLLVARQQSGADSKNN